MNELDFIAKYGPTGILGLLLVYAGKVGLKLMDRGFALADKIEASLDTYMLESKNNEANADKRHAETREAIALAAKETRHAVRTDLTEIAMKLGISIQRVEDICLGKLMRDAMGKRLKTPDGED